MVSSEARCGDAGGRRVIGGRAYAWAPHNNWGERMRQQMRLVAGVLSVFGVLAVGAVCADAQVATGAIAGSVVDATGRPIDGAEVRVDDPLHGGDRTALTDASGLYRLVGLTPSSYRVVVTAAGFREVTRRDVPVAVDSTARIDFELPLATIAETVQVSGRLRTLQTTSGDLGTVIDRQRIENLPLNSRDFLQLSLLAPGVQGPVDGSELSSRGSFAMHANGGREEFNDFLLDGVDNNDPYVNRYVVQPSVDSVQEFKIETNSYSAQYGRNAAAQVNVVTRRGTSRLEGFAYEYFRNEALDAANYFDENGKQPFNRNQFGGGAGGPLGANTFFFGALDLLREREGLSRLGSVPTSAARTGDLSGLGVTVSDPFTGQPFAGNVIPAERISPIAKQILALFPGSNRSGSPNYLGQPVQRNDQTQGTVRIDHRVSDSSQLTVRYAGGSANLFEPYTEGTGVTAGFGDLVDDRTWNVMAQFEQTFRSRALNSVRFGANGFSRDLLTENHGTDVGAAWGVNWLNVSPTAFGYPIVDVAGYSRIGDAYSLPLIRDTETYQLADDLAIDKADHLIRIGGEARHVRLNSQVDLFSRGQLAFTGAFTGSGLGDLLLGFPTFGIQAQADNPIHMRTNAWSAYVQDDWRLRPDLTVNLGVRYEYVSPPVDANNGMTTFDLANGQLAQVGTNGVSRSGIRPDRNNFAPRIGASWRVTPGTVIRGGYGLFYDSGMLTVFTAPYFNPPQFNLRLFFPSATRLLTLNDPFPLSAGFTPPPTLSLVSPDLVNGYLQHWNVAVQREINAIGNVTIAYAGSNGSNLVRPRNLNQATPGAGDVQGRRPYPTFSDIFVAESAGRSQFHSLQATLDRPLTHGMSFLAVYTLSKSMDDASAFLGTPADPNFPQDSHNPGAEWAPSSFDVRHRLTLAYVVQLPDTNVWTRNMQIEGITVIHSGQPFTPILRFDNSNTGNTGGSTAGSDRPNLVGDPELSNPTATEWFNTSAFVIPPPYTFGNAGRNSVRGPGFASFDLAVSKRLPLGASTGLIVGVQAFNLFNRTNFDQPEHFVDEPSTFGRIFSAKAPRQVQVSARIAF